MTGILAALVLELMRESLTGTHCRYREHTNGVPHEEYEVLPCGASAASAGFSSPASAAQFIVNGRLVRRTIKNNTAYDYDAASGALLRTIPLWFNAAPARVFDPNPVVEANDPSLRDRNDAASAVPESDYRQVEVGPSPYVTIVDRQAPFIAPADLSAPSLVFDRANDAFEDVSAVFHIDRNQRHLQSLGYSGARQIAAYAVEVDTHAANGDDNSFFQPSFTQAGRGTLYFGTGGTDDAEDADLLVHEYGHAIQEWIAPGTFLGTFASQSRALSEGFGDYWAYSAHHAQRRASGRDPYCFADWDARCEGDDPGENCGYPAGSDCLRRLDSTRTMADYDRGDTAGTEHRNGEIWSAALVRIFNWNVQRHGLEEGRRITDTLVVEALFGTPSNPTFATMAGRILAVDRLLFGGAHDDFICEAMARQRIAIPFGCGYMPRGELTLFQTSDRALPIPENDLEGVTSQIAISEVRAIERVLVRVDIAHPSRGDLRIVLIAPDGTRVVLQQVSFDRTRDLHATFGLDAVPVESLDVLNGHASNGTWRLNVSDLRALDAGTLESWGLIFQFAGDAPAFDRPAVSSGARVIPVVAHAPGANGTFFRTDLHLLNRGVEPQRAMLIFTPSEAHGGDEFSAAAVVVPPGHVVALRDVLPSVLGTNGHGSLVVDGNVLAVARMYTAWKGGTAGHAIDAIQGTSGAQVFEMSRRAERFNVGITETAGVTAFVDITLDETVGVVEKTIRRILPPFSHVQFPATSKVTVRSSTPVAAYMSAVNVESNDALYLGGTAYRTTVAPAARTAGANGSWVTGFVGPANLAFIDQDGLRYLARPAGSSFDVIGDLFTGAARLGVLRADRPVTITMINGPLTSLVPPSSTGVLFPVERSEGFRTNLTLLSDVRTVARMTVYDAAGHVIDAFDRALERDAFVQVPLAIPVVDGRIVVEGEGVHAWASVIDNASGDSTILRTY